MKLILGLIIYVYIFKPINFTPEKILFRVLFHIKGALLNISALKTLEILCGYYETDNSMEDGLNQKDLIMVKEVLTEMAGMISVKIQNVKVRFNHFSLKFKFCLSFVSICIYCLILVPGEEWTRNYHVYFEK